MNFKDIAELVELVETPDGYGGYTETEVKRNVFVNQKSIRQSEFYQAHAVGLKPEVTLVLRQVDYGGEGFLIWNGKRYDILRTYSKNGELVELVCAKRTEVM